MLRKAALSRLSTRLATYDADLTVIGGGPGGYVAAIKAAPGLENSRRVSEYE